MGTRVGTKVMATGTDDAFLAPERLAGLLDHTLLKPEATRDQLLRLAEEAAQYRFACAMANPAWVPLLVERLRGTGVPVGTVIGFPLGASLTATKVAEARAVAELGAHDIDMVINIGWLRSGMDEEVAMDIRSVTTVAHAAGSIVKVILETCLLGEEEKRRGARLAIEAGADFLKTSTGFSTHGATAEDVALLREAAGLQRGVKASGGVRTLEDARRMVAAGASRIGTSGSVTIVEALALELVKGSGAAH